MSSFHTDLDRYHTLRFVLRESDLPTHLRTSLEDLSLDVLEDAGREGVDPKSINNAIVANYILDNAAKRG